MTPQSLMAFVFAFILALPASAADPWVSFEVNGQAYFAHASERDSFVRDESAGKQLPLYTGTRQPAPAARLVRGRGKVVTLQRDRATKPVVANDAMPRVQSAPIATPPPPVKRASDAPAQTVDPDVAKILAVMPTLEAPARQKLAQELAMVKASDPAVFQKILDAAGSQDPKIKQGVVSLVTDASSLTDDGDRLTYIRTHAPSMLGGGDEAVRPGGSGNAVSGPNVEGEDTGAARNAGLNPIVQALIENNPRDIARKAAVDEIVKFAVDPARHFAVDAIAKDKGQLDKFTAGITAALSEKVSDAHTAQDIGFIYTVLLAGPQAAAPDWIAKPDSKLQVQQYLTAVAKAKEIFFQKMAEWSKDGPHQVGDRKIVGPWAGGGAGAGETSGQGTTVEAWTIAFVTDAGKQAKDSLNSDKIDKSTVDRVTKGLEKGWNDPVSGVPTTGDGGDRSGIALNFTAASFTTAEIYRSGAITRKFTMLLPGHDKPEDVELAFKLKFRQQNGIMVPMLDIVDVTHDADGGNGRPAHIYGQAFDLQQISPTAGDLRLQNDPNSYYDKDKYPVKYQLSRGADGTIHFGIGEDKLDIPQDKLYSEYTDSVMHNAHTVVVNGHQFQVLCQGGQQLQYAFYETKDGKLVNAANLQPSMVSAAIKKMSFDDKTHLPSETQTTSADLPLGYIGNKPDGTQQYYGLKWNAQAGFYDIVPEDKEIPDPNTPAPTTTPTSNTPVTSTGTPTDQQPAQTSPTDGNTGNNNTTGSNGTSSSNTKSAAEACTPDAARAAASFGAPFDSPGGFHYWTTTTGESYFCLYGDKYMHASGYLSSIEFKDGQLLIKTVHATSGMTGGIVQVDASKVSGGRVDVTPQGKPDKVTLNVDGIFYYRIDGDKLAARPAAPRPAEAGFTAWLQENFLGSDPSKEDSMRVNFDADAPARAARVVEVLAHLSPSDSGLFGGDLFKDNRAKLKKFLDLQIKADTGKLDADNPPYATISLNLADATKSGDVADYSFRDHHTAGLRWVVPDNGVGGAIADPK